MIVEIGFYLKKGLFPKLIIQIVIIITNYNLKYVASLAIILLIINSFYLLKKKFLINYFLYFRHIWI